MYERENNSGYTIQWHPVHTDLAEQAVEEHKGQGVPEDVTLPEDASVPVDADTARSITHRYRELVLDRDIRAALDESEQADTEEEEQQALERAEELKQEYQEHTGEEWEE